MSFLDYFRSSKPSTASLAKERLQIVIAHERANRNAPDYFPMMQRDILEVIRKYVPINDDQLSLQVEQDGDYEVLELNITLADQHTH